MPSRNKDSDFIAKVLTHLGLEKRKVSHGQKWFHEEKQFTIQVGGSPGDHRSIKNLHAEVSRKIREHYSYEELTTLLEPFTKKRKLKVLPEGKLKIGAFYKKEAVEYADFMNRLLKPPQKKFSTSISEENLDKLKRYSFLNEQSLGDTIEMLMNQKSKFFDNLPDIETIKKVKNETPSFTGKSNKKLSQKELLDLIRDS